MRHAFSFSSHIREAVRNHVLHAIENTDPRRFRQEPIYIAALLRSLEGAVYEGPDGHVIFKATIVDSIGRGTAESWSGADFAITATISDDRISVEKAILGQAKLGDLDDLREREVDRLLDQIKKIREFTRAPKVFLVPEVEGRRWPIVVSGNKILEGARPTLTSLPNYFVRRILTTLDGDTRPHFVSAVRESDLSQLNVIASTKRRNSGSA